LAVSNARNIEKGFTPDHKNVHCLWGEEPEQHNTFTGPHKAEALIEHKKAIEAKGEFKKVPLDPRVPDRAMCISAEASQQEQAGHLAFLDKNNDVFPWSTSDFVGVSRDIIEHRLQVSLSMKPKKQKLRKMLEEKLEATKVEVQRLLDAGFIREVAYPQWLANIVMVRKKNDKW
jgi:recombinational DNA repair ATPase RecF